MGMVYPRMRRKVVAAPGGKAIVVTQQVAMEMGKTVEAPMKQLVKA